MGMPYLFCGSLSGEGMTPVTAQWIRQANIEMVPWVEDRVYLDFPDFYVKNPGPTIPIVGQPRAEVRVPVPEYVHMRLYRHGLEGPFCIMRALSTVVTTGEILVVTKRIGPLWFVHCFWTLR